MTSSDNPMAGGSPFGDAVHPEMQWPPAMSPPPSPSAPQAADPYAPTGWSSPFEDFVAPSGQRCLLRKMDISDLLQAGILEHMDTLGGIVDNEVIRPATGQPPVDVRKVMKNPQVLGKLVPMLDKVLAVVVEKPTLHPKPAPGEERVEGRAYIDAVSIADKIAIFNRAAGDLDDLKSVRPEPA